MGKIQNLILTCKYFDFVNYRFFVEHLNCHFI